MNYEEALLYLENLNSFGIKLGLERIKNLVQLLGNPQDQYKTIHITGTNGKGSTTAMLAKILMESGIKAGMYSSPHLISYTERMKIGDTEISTTDFAETITVVSKTVTKMLEGGDESPTQFEVLTAAAFYYFAQQKVEYAVIEVGLGGLLDSTNIIMPEVSVITNIEMDHADRCGGSIESIAENKAGIIKDNIPLVVGIENDTIEIVEKIASRKKALVYRLQKDFNSSFEKIVAEQQVLRFSNGAKEFSYNLNLLGEHQIKNSALACQVALLLSETNPAINIDKISSGLSKAVWPGRFEIISNNPLVVIDGAHNLAGAKALAENLKQYFPNKQRVLLLGILKDKDVEGIIQTLVLPDDLVVVTEPDSERAASAEIVAEKVSAKFVTAISDSQLALKTALALKQENSILCVAGSLYLIGKIRSLLKANS